MKQNELHIINTVLAGRTENFGYFLDHYGNQVFNLIVRITGSAEDAEELTQDSFMKAFEHLTSFHGDCSFSTWIYRIAYNTALSSLRKKQEEMLSLDERLWNTVSDEEIDDTLNSEQEEQISKLHEALGKLTPDERALITLFYEEDHPVNEIAYILHISESNVKVKLHRIRKKLYVLMTQKEDNYGRKR